MGGFTARKGGATGGATARATRGTTGAVLLEVVMALVLFVGAASVITISLNASIQAVITMKLQTKAHLLAAGVLAEIEMGARSISTAAMEAFEPPFDQWNFSVQVGPAAEGFFSKNQSLRKVTITVRHSEENIVHTVADWIDSSQGESKEKRPDASASLGGGQ